jgi:hypothetical protein
MTNDEANFKYNSPDSASWDGIELRDFATFDASEALDADEPVIDRVIAGMVDVGVDADDITSESAAGSPPTIFIRDPFGTTTLRLEWDMRVDGYIGSVIPTPETPTNPA